MPDKPSVCPVHFSIISAYGDDIGRCVWCDDGHRCDGKKQFAAREFDCSNRLPGCILYNTNTDSSEILKFTIMGFVAAIVVYLTLFNGKHHF